MARFGYEWLRYPDYLDQEERAIFLNEVQIPKRDFHERLVLDAGCGMGRFTRIAGQLGGEVVGIDISPSVEKAYEITRNLPCTHIVQGNIMQPPLRTGCFDIVYSLGVLHHTPDPRRCFLNLAQLAKEGGRVSVWVYGTAGRFKDFATNPLRKDRKIYVNSPVRHRIHWALVLMREALSDGVRHVTTRFPHTPLYFACHLLALVGKMPILKYLTASVHPHWRVRVLENFDWFSPPYQSHHTKEEILGWFEEAGLQEVTTLPHGFIPKVGISGERATFAVPQPTA
jgi:SAM-dependent methyltransferase